MSRFTEDPHNQPNAQPRISNAVAITVVIILFLLVIWGGTVAIGITPISYKP